MSQIDFEGRGQWGRLVRSRNGGHTKVYELAGANFLDVRVARLTSS